MYSLAICMSTKADRLASGKSVTGVSLGMKARLYQLHNHVTGAELLMTMMTARWQDYFAGSILP
jgi:hypothetical protein